MSTCKQTNTQPTHTHTTTMDSFMKDKKMTSEQSRAYWRRHSIISHIQRQLEENVALTKQINKLQRDLNARQATLIAEFRDFVRMNDPGAYIIDVDQDTEEEEEEEVTAGDNTPSPSSPIHVDSPTSPCYSPSGYSSPQISHYNGSYSPTSPCYSPIRVDSSSADDGEYSPTSPCYSSPAGPLYSPRFTHEELANRLKTIYPTRDGGVM